ncbi:MAG: preprotein translocase subunit SecG [Pseudomonadota bacterium]
MENVLIVIHLLVVIALVVVVLLQRSEGGGLGIGGGGGGGMMSARGAADTLTRTTAILAACFFATSVALGLVARYGDDPATILDRIGTDPAAQTQDGVPTQGGVLDLLGGPEAADPDTPAVPTE